MTDQLPKYDTPPNVRDAPTRDSQGVGVAAVRLTSDEVREGQVGA